VIIGGNFTTNPWQRGTSFTAGSSGYTADRWKQAIGGTAVATVQQTADAPTAAEAGIYTQHCLHWDITTADASLAATDYALAYQFVEGFNAARFGFGQASTRYVTLSFWHKHTKTGTHCVSLNNSNGGSPRYYVAEYTQSGADTWEKAEITIPVDTTGTWAYNSNTGLEVSFTLAVGSTYQKTAGSWSSTLAWGTSNLVNNLDNVANNFKIALVQLEAGSQATDFEARDVGTELLLCQRYYQRWEASAVGDRFCTGFGPNTTAINAVQPHIVTMRAEPSLTYDALASWTLTDGAANKTPTVWTVSPSNGSVSRFDFTVSGAVAYRPYQLRAASAAGWYALDAEL
jgi:hypothetical protein